MRVFISSTMKDLIDERDTVAAILSQFNVFDVQRAERFGARADASQRACIDAARTADLVVLLIGGRYGFVPLENNPGGLSVTHQEYRAARANDVPVLAFCQRGAPRDDQVQGFLEEVEHFSTGVFRVEWASLNELAQQVELAVRNWLVTTYRRATADKAGGGALGEQLRSRLPISTEISATGLAPSVEFERWLGEVIRDAQHAFSAQSLPALIEGSAQAVTACRSIRILYSRRAGEDSWNLRVQSISALGVVERGPPVDLVVQVSDHGTAYLQRALYLLVLLEADRLRSAIAEGLSWAQAEQRRELSQEVFMNIAVAIPRDFSLIPELARAALAVELDQEATNLIVSLILAYIESLRRREASRSADIAQGWAIELLTRSLRQSRDKSHDAADVLYNLTRQLCRLAGDISLYEELLSAHPDYEARWYVHRDIGVLLFEQRQFVLAGDAYERAARLRKVDSELFRWAGDAAYYSGNWAKALPLFRRAVELDASELYFVADKLMFATSRVQMGEIAVPNQSQRERRSERLLAIAKRLPITIEQLQRWLLARALRCWPLNTDAAMRLAWLQNRRGRYADAASALQLELAAVPENPQARLNLALNLLTLEGDVLSEESRKLLEVAGFHGGPETIHHFATSLVNSPRREALLAEADIVLRVGWSAREARAARRADLKGPEQFGDTTHVEY